MCSHIPLLRRRAAMMRNDKLAFAQKLIGYAYTFIQQAARILTKIEDQTLQIAHLIQSICNFMLSRLIESGDVHIANARPDQEVQINAVARNLVADYREFERLI